MRPAVPRSQAGEKSLSERSDEDEAPPLEEAEADTVLLGVEAHPEQARPVNADRLPDADFFNGACCQHVAREPRHVAAWQREALTRCCQLPSPRLDSL